MALIGKIRKNMWLVIVLLAVALAGFIIMDMTNASNRGGGIFGSKNSVGKVNGKKIDINEFQQVENALYSGSNDYYGRRSSLWNYLIEKIIIDDYADKLGLGVGEEELTELEFGVNLSPIVQNNFRNPMTGQVDREQLSQFQTAINEGQELNPQFTSFWNEQRKQVIKTQKQTKLMNMISKAMMVTTWEANAVVKAQSETALIDFVYVAYDSIPDSEVKVTDEDIQSYLENNKKKYATEEETRSLSYVVFDVTPTAQDSQKIFDQIVALKENFIATKEDSAFVTSNQGFYAGTYAKKDELPESIKDTIANFSAGTVVGPITSDGAYTMFKIVSKKVLPDSAEASHILRSVQAGDALGLVKAKAYIDSLKNLINGGAKFEDLATTNSQDPGSATKGGDLGTFGPGTMVQPFNDAIFITGKEGGMYVVETQFGVHLIKVKKLKYTTNESSYKLAFISSPIVPSQETQDKKLDEVLAYIEKNKTLQDMEAGAKDKELLVASGLKKNDYILGELGSGQTSRDIIRWAFESGEKGKVSSTAYTYTDEVNFHDSKHVVVALSEITDAGIPSVAAARKDVEKLVINEKKAAKITASITGKDIPGIGSMYKFTPVTEKVNYSSNALTVGGNEPKVIGTIFKLKSGQTSQPIEGSTGVYVIKINNSSVENTGSDVAMQKAIMQSTARGQISFKLMDALRKGAEIDDNRFTFY